LGAEKGVVIGETINQLLKQRIVKIPVPKGALLTVAVDLTEDPFSGKKTNPAVTGGKPKQDPGIFITIERFVWLWRDIAIQSSGFLSPNATANGHGSC
jgi:hypothetical protein